MPPTENRFQREYNAGGLGLNCTTDGVSLAGVPLLRKTVGGLAPRPLDELAALMKDGYGHAIDTARLRRGLDVIADALNRDDIGRAMVAAIHLRLPSLDQQGAARIAFADEALNKYDPSEPRDAHGRWTTGGASSASASAKPTRATHPAGPANRPSASENSGIKPILVAGTGLGAVVESRLVIMGLSKACVNHAQEPRYFEKTQLCAAVMEQCTWLVRVNGENSLRDDSCLWPDGAYTKMKFGIMVPIRLGHPF